MADNEPQYRRIQIRFVQERETKGTVRFKEDTPIMDDVHIGILYVKKATLEAMGRPAKLTVTIEATE